jgi:hypothetical protein
MRWRRDAGNIRSHRTADRPTPALISRRDEWFVAACSSYALAVGGCVTVTPGR